MIAWSKSYLKGFSELPEIAEKELKKGASGNKETASIIRHMAYQRSRHPAIQKLARDIIHSYGVKSHNYLDECYVIGDFVKNNVRYQKDPKGIEQLTDPLRMVKEILEGRSMGDCDDMSLLICTLIRAAGHQPYIRIVKYKKYLGPYNHIYVVCYENNFGEKKKRLVLDAIVKNKPIGFELKHKFGKEYKV